MPPPRRPVSPIASAIFVNRDEPKRIFEAAALSIPSQGCRILTWYGVGGQGKTALARELFRMSAADVEPSYGHLRRAMVDLHGRPKTDPDRLLVWIRNAFSRAGISFHAFDLAFAIMWQKTRGEEALPAFEKPWLHRTSEGAIDAAPETVTLSREFLEESAGTIPGIGFLLKRGVKWSIDKSKRAWLEKTRPQLQAFYRNGELIEDFEMSALMPWMLAQDMNRHLAAHPSERFVLFIDEYERVMEGAGTGALWRENQFDTHLRSFIAETDALLALFFSRERLQWENDADWRETLAGSQHLLGGLSMLDADRWLREVPVADVEIRAAIIEGARETAYDFEAPIYPLLLDLQLQHWINLKGRATADDFSVEAESFEARRRELVKRLLRDYDDPVQNALAHLALLERFDREIFEHVVKVFNIPLAFDVFDKLASLSILSEADDGWLALHRAIADTIVQSSDEATLDRARDMMLAHLSERAMPLRPIDVNDVTLACYTEAARLRLQQGIEGYVGWLNTIGQKIIDAHNPVFLERIWRETLELVQNAFSEDHSDTAASYNNVAVHLDAQGRYREAEPFFRKSLEITQRVVGEDHPSSAASYNNVASSLGSQGRYSEAEPFFRKSLEITQRVLGGDHPDTASVYNNLASNLDDQGRPSDAEPLYQKALDVRHRVLGEDHPDTAASFNNVASNLDEQGRSSEAEPLHRKSLEIRRRVLGEDHPSTVASYNGVASNLQAQGRATEAEGYFRKALEITQRVLGEDHPDTAVSYSNVASNLDAQGRAPDAEPLHRKVLEIRIRLLGEEHPSTAAGYNSVASNLEAQGLTSEAGVFFRKAFEIRQRVLGENHPDLAASYNNVASNLHAQGRAEEAEPLLRKALEIAQRVLGEEHPNIAVGFNNLASNLDAQGRASDAEPLHRKALNIRKRVLGEDHPNTAVSYDSVASNLEAQDRVPEAERAFRKALEIRRRVLGEHHPDMGISYNNLASNLSKQGRASDAEPLHRKALEIAQRVLGEEHPRTAASFNNLASNLYAQGRASDAEPLHRKALEIAQRVLGEEHPRTAAYYNNLAYDLHAQGLASEAKPFFQKALNIRQSAFGKDHPTTKDTAENFRKLYR